MPSSHLTWTLNSYSLLSQKKYSVTLLLLVRAWTSSHNTQYNWPALYGVNKVASRVVKPTGGENGQLNFELKGLFFQIFLIRFFYFWLNIQFNLTLKKKVHYSSFFSIIYLIIFERPIKQKKIVYSSCIFYKLVLFFSIYTCMSIVSMLSLSDERGNKKGSAMWRGGSVLA